MKTILVVDDEQDLREILRFNLASSGYRIETAGSAEEAMGKLTGVDLILLDVMMDGMSGFEMTERLKKNPQTAAIPVIFLTAKDTERDLLHGFQLGADDYISKPFSLKEVKARVKAVLNRAAPPTPTMDKNLSYEGLVVDEKTKAVTTDGKTILLTPTELQLLTLFLTERGTVFSREELLRRVWRNDVIVTDRTVDVNITRLRKKVGRYAANIATRQGFGYYFEEKPSEKREHT